MPDPFEQYSEGPEGVSNFSRKELVTLLHILGKNYPKFGIGVGTSGIFGVWLSKDSPPQFFDEGIIYNAMVDHDPIMQRECQALLESKIGPPHRQKPSG